MHRADALRRIGHEVIHLNPRNTIPRHRLAMSLNIRTGFQIWQPLIYRDLLRQVGTRKYDMVWLDTGAEIGPQICRALTKEGRLPLINYNHDDPFSPRDGLKWLQYKRSIKLYDLAVVVRAENVDEARRAGARKVIKVIRPYDPVHHARRTVSQSERMKWTSKVVFVGSWWPERGPFMKELMRLGVPLSIWGGGWKKAPEFHDIQRAWRGAEALGPDYVLAIQCADIAIGLLSKGNRDLHTQRSTEIPYIGTAFCAERTSEHDALYEDGKEALFFDSPAECARLCHMALSAPARLAAIAASGHQRVLSHGLSNDMVLRTVLSSL